MLIFIAGAQNCVSFNDGFDFAVEITGDSWKSKNSFFKECIHFIVTKDVTELTPQWNYENFIEPPLLPQDAISLSLKEVKKYYSNAEEWRLKEVLLHNPFNNEKWFYVVRWVPFPHNSNDDPIGIPILMSGVTISGELLGECRTGLKPKYSSSLVTDSYTSGIKVFSNPLGKDLSYSIGIEDLINNPVWENPGHSPPPMPISVAIKISKYEIPKYCPNVEDWILEDIAIRTIGKTESWYYKISWRAKGSKGDDLGIPILMNGNPILLRKK